MIPVILQKFFFFFKSFDICCLTIDYEFQCEKLSEYSFFFFFDLLGNFHIEVENLEV